MDTLASEIGSYADIAFFILLAGIALRSLLIDRDAQTKQRKIWKEEFQDIESSIRTLIEEATQASEVFDRKLTRKQKSIEELLSKVEKVESTSFQPEANARVFNDDSVSRSVSAIEGASEQTDQKADTQPENGLRSTALKSTKRSEPKIKKSKAENKIADEFIASRPVEEFSDERPHLSDEDIFTQTSIVDLSAFKIAKRLLLEGKELHVIARKIDIPVSEVRHLDTLLREQVSIVDPEGKYYFSNKPTESVSNVIRDRSVDNESVSDEDKVRDALGFEGHMLPESEKTRLGNRL